MAIIATTADVRAKAIKRLLKNNKVKYLILEKFLFTKKKDYTEIGKLLKQTKTKAWVNCPMRMIPFYQEVKNKLANNTIFFRANGGIPVMIGSVLHYIDYMACITGLTDYTVNTDCLDKKPIPSKRKGFLELTGTLVVHFKNGSHGTFTFHDSGKEPVIVEVFNEHIHTIAKDSDQKAWVAERSKDWRWQELDFPLFLQSKLTTELVTDILKNRRCNLTPYEESAKLHLPLLESLKKFLNKNIQKKYNHYPFT